MAEIDSASQPQVLLDKPETNQGQDNANLILVNGVEHPDLTTNGEQRDGDFGMAREESVVGEEKYERIEAKPEKPDEKFTTSETDTTAPTTSEAAAASNPSPALPTATPPPTAPLSTLTAPPAKRFSAVNINKKFLEKNSAQSGSSSSGGLTLSVASSKLNSTSARPTPSSSQSQSRLVTAKLTLAGSAQSSAVGWSRSTATTPPIPNGVASGVNGGPTPAASLQLPNNRSRSSSGAGASDKARAGSPSTAQQKLAWAKINNAAREAALARVQNEFPTAAEVASGRKAKLIENQLAAEAVAAQKQAMLQTADSFRGVHLDPNAHHWDEMEDEDADFLGDTIDFGDGRQYKIQVEEELRSEMPMDPEQESEFSMSDRPVGSEASTGKVVTKEERFAEDIDRSWPRNQTALPGRMPAANDRPDSPASASTRDSYSLHSPDKAMPKALFNERLNRLEPWDIKAVASETGGTDKTVLSWKQHPSADSTSKDDTPQILHKDPTAAGVNGHASSFAAAVSSTIRPDPIPHRQSNATQEDTTNNRQSKPALGISLPTSSTVPRRAKESPLVPSTASQPRETPSVPPPRSRSSSVATSGLKSATGDVVNPIINSEDLVKATMATAAERAKKRRQEEEAEREAQKERARKKAAEMEAKIRAEQETKEAKVVEVPETPRSHPSQREPWRNRGSISQQTPKSFELQERRQVDGEIEPHQTRSSTASDSLVPTKPTPVEFKPPPPKAPEPPTPSNQAVSWRTTAAPLPPRPTPSTSHRRAESSSSQSTEPQMKLVTRVEPRGTSQPKLPVPPSLDILTIQAGEEVEVIDFSDLGKLVSASTTTKSPSTDKESLAASVKTPASRNDSRPRASDYFDSVPTPSTASKSDAGSWRKPAVTGQSAKPPSQEPLAAAYDKTTSKKNDINKRADAAEAIPPVRSTGVTRGISVDQVPPAVNNFKIPERKLPEMLEGMQAANATSVIAPIRSPRSQASWKEGSMSALDDTMSRIKGALSGLQAKETNLDAVVDTTVDARPTSHDRILPVSVPKVVDPKHIAVVIAPVPVQQAVVRREIFDVSSFEPPRSPKPAWNVFAVKIPPLKRPTLEPLSKKQHAYLSLPLGTVNYHFLTFAPVEGLAKRDLSRDNVLFHRFGKSKWKTRVSIPKKRLIHSTLDRRAAEAPKNLSPTLSTSPVSPKITPVAARVNLPQSRLVQIQNKSRTPWAPGRSKASDEGSWRRGPTSMLSISSHTVPEQVLQTVSRSPPPEISQRSSTPLVLPTTQTTASEQAGKLSQRKKPEPKLPPGTAVGFAVRQENQANGITSLVSFTVTSELEAASATPPLQSAIPEATSTVEPEQTKQIYNLADGEPTKSRFDQPSESTASSLFAQATKTPEKQITSPLPVAATPWGKSPLAFSVLESPSKPAPDSDHMKAVWNQTSEKTTSNSLKGIADDLTAIPFTLQDVKSEDGSTPPPQAGPVAPPSRVDVARAFQQVPQTSGAAQVPAFPGVIQSPTRSSNLRPVLPPSQSSSSISPLPTYSTPMLAHSPSPTLVYSPHVQPMQHIWPAGAPGRPAAFVRAPGPTTYIHSGAHHPQYIQYAAAPTLTPMYHTQGPSPAQPANHLQGAGRGRGVPLTAPMVARPTGTTPAQPIPGYPPTGAPMYVVQSGRPAYEQPQYAQQVPQPQPSNGLYNPVPAASFVQPW